MKIIDIPIRIKVITGLRIGSEKETFEIGGVDNPVIRMITLDEERIPIIPGSSLKGRIRCLLEKKYKIYKPNLSKEELARDPGIITTEEEIEKLQIPPENKEKGKRILKLFGKNKLLFSDLHPTKETKEIWKKLQEKDITYDEGTEIKMENVISRITGTAIHPRRMERIIKGSEFEGKVTYIVDDEKEIKNEEIKNDLELLKEGFELVEQTYLGSCGSRGYGRVDIMEKLEDAEEIVKEVFEKRTN